MPILPPETQGALYYFLNIFLLLGFDIVSHERPTPVWSVYARYWAFVRLRAARANITLRGIPTCLNYCIIFIVYTIYKCSRQPQYTTKRGAGFATHAVTSFLLISALCHTTHKQTTRLVCARRCRLNFLPR